MGIAPYFGQVVECKIYHLGSWIDAKLKVDLEFLRKVSVGDIKNIKYPNHNERQENV